MIRTAIAIAAALCAMLLPAIAASQTHAPYTSTRDYKLQLDDAAINTTKTVDIFLTDNGLAGGNAAYSRVVVQIDYTRSAGTAVVITWKCSLDGTSYPQDTKRDLSDNSLAAYTDTITGTVSFNLKTEYGVAGCRALQIDFIATAGDASDLVDVYVVAVAGT